MVTICGTACTDASSILGVTAAVCLPVFNRTLTSLGSATVGLMLAIGGLNTSAWTGATLTVEGALLLEPSLASNACATGGVTSVGFDKVEALDLTINDLRFSHSSSLETKS